MPTENDDPGTPQPPKPPTAPDDPRDVPETPPTEPKPVPIRDPKPDGAPEGPYIATPVH